MDEVEVDVVHAESPKALVEGLQRRVEALARVPELRRHEDVLARDSRARHRSSDTLLVAVGGGGVDVAVADLERLLDDLLRVVRRDLEDTEAELWDLDAVVEGDVRDLGHVRRA